MKLHILGSSSSGNSYILEASDGVLIIECGLPFIEVKKAIDFKIGRIVGAIVTHQHGDHAKYIAEYLKSAVRVCALKEVFDARAEAAHLLQDNRTDARLSHRHFQSVCRTCGTRCAVCRLRYRTRRNGKDAIRYRHDDV